MVNADNMQMEDHEGSASEQPKSSKVDVIKEYPVAIQSQLGMIFNTRIISY